jgi:DNA-binding transcriptional MerR regulator
MSEILALRGKVAINEKIIRSLTVGLDCDIDEIRVLCDKYEEKTNLDEERIQLVADRIANQIRQLKKLTQQTADIKRDLGE